MIGMVNDAMQDVGFVVVEPKLPHVARFCCDDAALLCQRGHGRARRNERYPQAGHRNKASGPSVGARRAHTKQETRERARARAPRVL